MEFIQTNKFTEFFDDEAIFFSKIDLIDSTVDQINLKKNNCVLIVGNGDLPYTNEIDEKVPSNVIKIFAQNNISSSKRVESIPLGIGNSQECKKSGHDGHRFVGEQEIEIFRSFNILKEENFKIYCNFNDYTFPEHRSKVKKICENTNYIEVEDTSLSFSDYIKKLFLYPLNVCPAGNGIDSYRIWETLYCGKIPITFRVNHTRSYSWYDNGDIGIYDDLYKKLPIIILDNESELENKNLIIERMYECQEKWENINLLDFNYWKNKILETIK